MIIAHIHTWDGKNEPTYTPPGILPEYSLYGHIETHAAPLVLFAIGGKQENGYSDNFDIYADKNGTLYSIPRPGSGCCGTYYGDRQHIKKLIRQNTFSYTLTTYGEKVMDINNKPWDVFNKEMEGINND